LSCRLDDREPGDSAESPGAPALTSAAVEIYSRGMTPQTSLREFRKVLKTAGMPLRSLLPRRGFDLLIRFYAEIRAEGCDLDADGDMLLYQWGCYDFGAGENFELDLTRQFITGEGEDDEINQLSLTFKSKPTPTLRKLGKKDHWCRAPEKLEEFRAILFGSPAFLAAEEIPLFDVELDYEAVG